ncbi:MAG: ATP-binding protein [Bacillota bacterium]
MALFSFYFYLGHKTEEHLRNQALTIARLTATRLDARAYYGHANPSEGLELVAAEVMQATNAAFVVFMNMDSIRYSHPNKSLIGNRFTGGDEGPALRGESYSSKAVGISGPSIRAFAPVYDFNQRQVGAVAVGFFQPEISEIMSRIYKIFYAVTPLGLAVVLLFSILLSKNIKNIMFGMEPREIATLLKERETMLMSVKEGVIAIDKNCNVTVINQAAQKLLAHGDEAIGKPITNIIPNSRLPEVMHTMQAEYDQYLALGGNTILTNRLPLVINGEVVGAIATFRPLNEVSRLAEELTGVKKIINSIRAHSHEFLNKMHVISGLIQLGSYEEAKRYITNITSRNQQLIAFLTENIHNDAVAGLLLGKASEAEEKNIDLDISDLSQLFSLPPHFDEHAMVVVLGNLIENAFDAVADQPSPRRKVWVEVRQTDWEISLQVIDYGPGIPPEIGDKIYQEGYTTKNRGSGLGLAIIKTRITAAGGKIQYYSNQTGTTFTVTIPYSIFDDQE